MQKENKDELKAIEEGDEEKTEEKTEIPNTDVVVKTDDVKTEDLNVALDVKNSEELEHLSEDLTKEAEALKEASKIAEQQTGLPILSLFTAYYFYEVKKNQRHTTNRKPNMYRDINKDNQYFRLSNRPSSGSIIFSYF